MPPACASASASAIIDSPSKGSSVCSRTAAHVREPALAARSEQAPQRPPLPHSGPVKSGHGVQFNARVVTAHQPQIGPRAFSHVQHVVLGEAAPRASASRARECYHSLSARCGRPGAGPRARQASGFEASASSRIHVLLGTLRRTDVGETPASGEVDRLDVGQEGPGMGPRRSQLSARRPPRGAPVEQRSWSLRRLRLLGPQP